MKVLMNIKQFFLINFDKTVLLMGITLLSGCMSIPEGKPNLTSNASSVKFESVYGPLPSKQNEEVLDELRKNNPVTNIFDKHLAVEDKLAAHPLVIGNKAELLIFIPPTKDIFPSTINSLR